MKLRQLHFSMNLNPTDSLLQRGLPEIFCIHVFILHLLSGSEPVTPALTLICIVYIFFRGAFSLYILLKRTGNIKKY